MLRSRIVAASLALVVMLTSVPLASANWYAGNRQSSQYGAKAIIYAPGSAPYTPTWQDHWVSTAATPSFVQAGWNYGPSIGYARPYVEHLVGGTYGREWYGSQTWGSGVWYQVDQCYPSTWCGYVAGSNKGGWGPVYAPVEVQALSEVHDYSTTVIDTWFSTVSYKDSSGYWRYFDQANWVEDYPYKVNKSQYYYYHTYRGP